MNDFLIRKLSDNDWQEYKSIRLEALSAHPNFFSPSRDETKFLESDWRSRLSNADACMFGLFLESQIVGLTGVVRDRSNPENANLVSSYIRAEYRKRGISRLFYDSRMKWANEQGNIKFLIVEHYEDNTPSMRAHQKFGFIYTSSYEEAIADGIVRKTLVYRLPLLK